MSGSHSHADQHRRLRNTRSLRLADETVPYNRIGEPDDVGNAVFLASGMADYATGASIYVDGGMILYPGFASGG